MVSVFTDRDSAAAVAWAIACPGGSQRDTKLRIPDVVVMIDVAVKAMCEEVFKSGEKYRLMMDFTTVTLGADGSAPLDDLVIGESVKPMYGGTVNIPNSSDYPYYFDYFEFLEELHFPRNIAGVAGYCVTGGNATGAMLYCTDGVTGDGLGGVAVTVKACQYYSFETLPEQLKDDFVRTLANMAKAKLEKMDSGQQSS